MSKSKKILIALGISMMGALPLTQAASQDQDSIHMKPAFTMEQMSNDSDRDDRKNPPPQMSESDKNSQHMENDKNGNPPPPPPGDESDSDRAKHKPDGNFKPDENFN